VAGQPVADHGEEPVRLVEHEGVAAVVEDDPLGAGDAAGDPVGLRRRAEDVVAAGEDQGRRADLAEPVDHAPGRPASATASAASRRATRSSAATCAPRS
jgi:hypothetical protein